MGRGDTRVVLGFLGGEEGVQEGGNSVVLH